MADPAPLIQPEAYYEDGRLVPPHELDQAIESGAARWHQGARVPVRNADGELGTVDAAEAYQPGVRVLTAGELKAENDKRLYGTGDLNVAKATALTLARGFTGGISDEALTRGGEDRAVAERLQAYKEQNPTASSGYVEAAGALASLAAGGIGGAAGKVARVAGALPNAAAAAGNLVERGVARGLARMGVTGESLAGRVASKALATGAQGATEGAFYGVGQAMSESSLTGEDLTAEKMLAHVGRAALFGAGIGGAVGAASPLVGAAVKKGAEKLGGMEQFARERAINSVAQGSDIRKLIGRKTGEAAEAKFNATADDLLSYEFKTGPLKGERVMKAARNTDELLGRIRQAKDELGAAIGGIKQEIDDVVQAAPHLKPDVGSYLKRVDDEVLKPLKTSKSPGMRSKARAVERELSVLKAEHEARLAGADLPAPGFKDLDEFRANLREQFQPPRPTSGGIPAPPPKSAKYLEKAERILADHLDNAAERALKETGENADAFRQLKRQFSSFADLDGIAQRVSKQQIGNRTVSPSDHAMGMSAFLGTLVHGGAGALGSLAAGAAGTIANKMLRERGNSLLAEMAYKASQSDALLDGAAKALAGKVAALPRRTAIPAYASFGDLRKSYDAAAARVQELADPHERAGQLAALTAEIGSAYPDAGSALSRKLLQMYDHLQDHLPSGNSRAGATLTPLAAETRTSPSEMRKFMSRVRAATDPDSVIEDLAEGKIDRDALDTLKALDPQRFLELRQKVILYTAENKEELSFPRRIMLSVAFEFPGDSSLLPGRMAGLQASAQSSSAQQSQGGPPKGSSNIDPSITSALALPSETEGQP